MISTDGIILMYIKNESNRKQIETLCDKMAIAVKQLKPADLNKTIGSLAGIKGINGSKSVNVPFGYMLPDLMIFSGINDKKLDSFLENYRNEAIDTVGLKAVVTTNNINWTLYELIQELKQEHIKFTN